MCHRYLYMVSSTPYYYAQHDAQEVNKTMTPQQDTDNANKIFDAMRNLITDAVMCRQCQTIYHEIEDTEIIDIETNEPAFYCTACGERL